MHGRGDGVDEALIRVRREIYGDLCRWCDGSRDLNVEFHFAIGPAGIACGRIFGAVDGNCGDLRSGNSEAAEKLSEIGRVVSAAEFNQRNALAGAGYARRKTVGLRDLKRRIGNIRGTSLDVGICLAQTEMRLGLGPVIEAENAFDDAIEVSGNCERAGAAAIRAGSVVVAPQAHAKCVVETLNRAGEFYGAACAVLTRDFQTVLRGERTNLFDVLRRCAMLFGEFFAGEIFPIPEEGSIAIRSMAGKSPGFDPRRKRTLTSIC